MELLGFKFFLYWVLIDTVKYFTQLYVSVDPPTAVGEHSSCSTPLPACGIVLSI